MAKTTTQCRTLGDYTHLEIDNVVQALGSAVKSVHRLLGQIEKAALADVIFVNPRILLTNSDHLIGEEAAIRSAAEQETGSEILDMQSWGDFTAKQIADGIRQDHDGVFFTRLVDLTIIVRARRRLGDGNGRLEAFNEAVEAFQEAADDVLPFFLPCPYAVLNTANADLALQENRAAAEIVDFANAVASRLYDDLEGAAKAGLEYNDAFVLMNFDKMTVGEGLQVGVVHQKASVAAKTGKVMLFEGQISAADILRAFRHEEMELRVHLVSALVFLRQLHERGRNLLVEKQLESQIASVKARLWYGAYAS